MSGRGRRNGLVAVEGDIIAFTYARVSSKDQEKDGMSLPVQDKENLRYITAHPPMVFGGAFVDVETGSVLTRSDYQQLLATVRATIAAGKRAAIITVKQTRLGRDVEEAARAWKELGKLGAEIHSTRDGGLLDDELMYMIRAVLAQNDLRVIREGVKATFAEVRANGWLKPGKRPWGYVWQPATKEQDASGAPNVIPVPHPEEAPYVAELFERRANGASLRELARWVRALPETATGGRQFAIPSIRDRLQAPVYVARNPEAGVDLLDVPPGKWEPLVDDATWRQIHPRAGTREYPVALAAARGDFPLTGYLFCEVCGARMSGQTRRYGSDPVRRNYMCSSRMLGDRHARVRCYRTISAAVIERLVFGTLGSLVKALADPRIVAEARRIARELERKASATGDARRLVNAEAERARLAARRIKWGNLLADGSVTVEAYHEAIAPLTAEIEKQDVEIVRLSGLVAAKERRGQEKPYIDVILTHAPFWHEALERGTVEDKRAFLKLVVERIVPRRVGPGKYLAGIERTPLGEQLLQVGATVLPTVGGGVEVVQAAWANCPASTPPAPAPPAA